MINTITNIVLYVLLSASGRIVSRLVPILSIPDLVVPEAGDVAWVE